MDDLEKIKLIELVTGIREPETGLEKHFLKVINKDAIPCTTQEKEWYSFYEKSRSEGRVIRHRFINNETGSSINKSEGRPKQPLKWVRSSVHQGLGRRKSRYERPVKEYRQSNMYLERLEAQKHQERLDQISNGPKPAPIEATKAELQKFKPVKNTTSYQIDEGIGGSREENKKMRGQVWSEILKRNKE